MSLWRGPRRAPRQQKARFDVQQVGQLLEHRQVDGPDLGILEATHRGPADPRPSRELGLGETEGLSQLAQAQVDGHGSTVRLGVLRVNPNKRRTKPYISIPH
jgi:hypothetical protein